MILLAIVFLWIGGFGTIFFPVIALVGGLTGLSRLVLGSTIHSESWLKIASFTLGSLWYFCYVAYLGIGIGILKLKNWARKCILGINVFGMVAGILVAVVFVRPFWMTFAVSAWCFFGFGWLAWYLMRPRVRHAFGAWRKYTPAGEWIQPPGLSRRGKFLVGVTAGVTTIGLFTCSLFFGVSSMMRESVAYRMTMETAQSSSCLTNAIGSPFKPGWMLRGSTEESANEGSAELSIPIEGPKGKGALNVAAKKAVGKWEIKSLVFTGGSRDIQLIPANPTSPCE